MREFLQSGFTRLFFVCATALLCDLLAENAKKSSCYKALKLICALCVCLTVFSLFSNDLSDEKLKQAFEKAEQSMASPVTPRAEPEAALLEKTRVELTKQTKQILFEKYGITPTGLDISFNVTKQDGQTIVSIDSVQAFWEEGIESGTAFAAGEELHTLFGEAVKAS